MGPRWPSICPGFILHLNGDATEDSRVVVGSRSPMLFRDRPDKLTGEAKMKLTELLLFE